MSRTRLRSHGMSFKAPFCGEPFRPNLPLDLSYPACEEHEDEAAGLTCVTTVVWWCCSFEAPPRRSVHNSLWQVNLSLRASQSRRVLQRLKAPLALFSIICYTSREAKDLSNNKLLHYHVSRGLRGKMSAQSVITRRELFLFHAIPRLPVTL